MRRQRTPSWCSWRWGQLDSPKQQLLLLAPPLSQQHLHLVLRRCSPLVLRRCSHPAQYLLALQDPDFHLARPHCRLKVDAFQLL